MLQLAVYAQEGQINSGLLSMLRLVRLARLQRIVRLLRYRIFSELTLMVKGVAAGLRTLFWAIVLLFFVVYVFALVLRQLLVDDIDSCIAGDSDLCSVELGTGLAKHLLATHIEELFGSVPHCMFTVFRCVSGDCNSPKGTPVVMALYDVYGGVFVLPYCVAFLFVTFGIFNLIVAIFVETVLEAARQKRRVGADHESLQFGHKLQRLLIKFLNVEGDTTNESPSCWQVCLSKAQQLLSVKRSGGPKFVAGDTEFDQKITRAMFVDVVHDPKVKEILDDLDVGAGEDRAELFDVLDADDSGELDLRELVVGLMKLRGGADKSDVVAALLGVRALQRLLKDYMAEVGHNFDVVLTRQKEILGRLGVTDGGLGSDMAAPWSVK
eukprot:TRINITY_DN12809_c0_g1_i1.p1 TRINITY_DN12809_c0_g1~~TRINITY_DN12809_c0_g1_i1.p1  ORF type:complete len:381 (+),score=81.35 TRINITY_DN12809_c0_g1_i1:363-1505(+)